MLRWPSGKGVCLSTQGSWVRVLYDSRHDNSTGWFQEADSRVINLSCDKVFHNRAKINMVKLNINGKNMVEINHKKNPPEATIKSLTFKYMYPK